MFFDGTPNQAVCTRLSRENRLTALQRVHAEVTSTLRTLRRALRSFFHLEMECQHLCNKRENTFAKPRSHASILPLFSEVGWRGIPAMLHGLPRPGDSPWIPVFSTFVEKEPVVVFVWYILTSNQHWDRFLVIIGKTQNVKVSRYLYHTSHRLNFSMFWTTNLTAVCKSGSWQPDSSLMTSARIHWIYVGF